MATVKFYTGVLKNYAHDGDDTTLVQGPGDTLIPEWSRDLHSIRVLEADSFDGAYTEIAVVKIQPAADHIFASGASDQYLQKWYRLEFITDPSAEEITILGRTDPVVPEDLMSVVDRIRSWLGDVDVDSPAWPDQHYVETIRFAMKQHRGDRNMTFLRDDDIVPIQLLVRESFCMVIAYDHAKYYEMKAPAAVLDKSQIMSHYLEVARGIREEYEAIQKRLNLGSGGYDDQMIINQMPAPNVVNAKRFSRTAGIEVDNIGPSRYRRREFFFPGGQQ